MKVLMAQVRDRGRRIAERLEPLVPRAAPRIQSILRLANELAWELIKIASGGWWMSRRLQLTLSGLIIWVVLSGAKVPPADARSGVPEIGGFSRGSRVHLRASPVGIRNEQNYCYLSSVLQMVFYIPELRGAILGENPRNAVQLALSSFAVRMQKEVYMGGDEGELDSASMLGTVIENIREVYSEETSSDEDDGER